MQGLQTESPQNVFVEALNLNVTPFGDKACKEVIKVKWSHKRETLIHCDQCPCKRREGCIHIEEGACADIFRRKSSASQGMRLYEKPTPWSWASSPQTVRKQISVVQAIQSVILLWQLQQTNTTGSRFLGMDTQEEKKGREQE